MPDISTLPKVIQANNLAGTSLSQEAFHPKDLWRFKHDQRWETIAQGLEEVLRAKNIPDLEADCWRAELAFAQLKLSQDYAPDGFASRYFAENALLNATEVLSRATPDSATQARNVQIAKKVCLSLNGSDSSQINDLNGLHEARSTLREYLDLCKRTNADSATVFISGELAAEYRSASYLGTASMMSSTKSVAACLIKIAEEKNLLCIDAPAHQYFSAQFIERSAQSIPAASPWHQKGFISRWDEGEKASVTIRHLLTHTSGLPGNNYCATNGLPQNISAHTGDYNLACASLPLVRRSAEKVDRLQPLPAETNFDYSNAGCQLLSVVLETAVAKLGMSVSQFAQEFLFDKLGMRDTKLGTYDGIHVKFDAEMISTPRDFEPLGRMMLQLGRFDENQIISPQGVKELLTPSNKVFLGGAADCGQLWWLTPWGFGTEGYLDNSMHILPECDAVIVRTQDWPPRSQAYPRERDLILAKLIENL